MERRNTSRKRRGGADKRSADTWEQWLTARLFICLTVCAAMVCVKYFAPELMERIRYRGMEIIGTSADYKAAFRSIGQAIAGEKPMKEAMTEAYEYAFSVSEVEDAVEADAPAEEQEPEESEAEEAEAQAIITEVTPKVENLADAPADESEEIAFPCAAPVTGVITSPFGYRLHPTLGVTRFHKGVDIGADSGTEIRAFADGTVYATGESATLGKYIMLDHDDGVRTVYGHCSEVYVTDGDSVTLGQHIADVGRTGNATGNCLHFEVYINGDAVDPQRYFTCA